MIDLHSHVLPTVDDGPRTLEESLALLRAAEADGIERLAATPHVTPTWPTSPTQMETALARVRTAARDAGIAVDVLAGGELDLGVAEHLDDESLRRFGLGGNSELLLVEFPWFRWPPALAERLCRLRDRGFTLLLAHPERNPEVREAPERLRELVDDGHYMQLTAAAIDGRHGPREAATAKAILDAGLAHVVAGDAHMPAVREVGLSAAVSSLDDPNLARWLTRDVPAALVAGEQPPRRPASRTLTARH
jgi:protein-tyrosine phosphatase